MGQDSSKQADAPTFVSLPNDIDLPDATEGGLSDPAAAVALPPSAAAREGEGSFDQLPTLPPPTPGDAAGTAIVRDLGDYRLEKQVLGEGAFGKVRLATSVRTGHRVAVKVIKRKKLNERAEVLLQREVKHHEKLRHPNIVRLHTFIMTPNKYYLVMEYCEGGDLLHYINNTPLLSDELARTLFRGLIDGLRFCHVLGIHHRDLKLENLMLTSRDEQIMQLKIADFGLSDLQSLPSSLSATFCGSPLYAAPELMTAGAAPDGYDASKSDVWSCGVILYALLASALPFDAEDICALVRLIQRGVPNSPVPEARGPAAASLVATMLTVDPKTRPTATDVLADAWVNPPPVRKEAIKASVTTLKLPQDGGAKRNERRRGASETTSFFKDLKNREKLGGLEEALEATPSTAPPSWPAPVVAAPEGMGGAQPQQQREAPPAMPTAPAAAPPTVGSGGGGDMTKRLPGQPMTRAELAEMKAKGEANESGAHSATAAVSSEGSTGAPREATRKGGAQLTKEELEEIAEIKRAMAEEKERARREKESSEPQPLV